MENPRRICEKKTIISINRSFSDEKSSKVFEQPVRKNLTAVGLLFEESCRLEARMKELQKAENGMLKPKVVDEHKGWHSSSQKALRNIFERMTRSHWQMNWVSVTIFELQIKASSAPYCRLEDKKLSTK